jgi:hypothetical protein
VKRVLLAIACGALAAALVALRPLPTPGPAMRDFEAYWAAGAAQNAGADPYGRAVWAFERQVPGVEAARDEMLPFIGPPATLLAWSALARLPYGVAAPLWGVLLALALGALVATIVAASGAPLAPFTLLAMLVLAAGCGPVTSDLALGQIALLAALGASALTLVAPRSLPLAVPAALLAFAQPNAALGLVSQLGRNRATAALAIGAALTYFGAALGRGWAWPAAYASAAAAHLTAERFDAIQLTPASIVYGLGATPRVAAIVALAAAFTAMAAAIAIALRVSDRFARFAAFAALSPFVASFFHEHDLVVAFAAMGWAALRTHGWARRLALAGTLLVSIDWLGLAQRPTGIAQSALLALAALCAFVAMGEDDALVSAMPTALASALLFAVAAWAGAHHPMPVWPDALGDYRAPAGATVAAIWSDEQRAAGLHAAVFAWAFLRTLSLLGCALLAAAIYRHSTYRRTA